MIIKPPEFATPNGYSNGIVLPVTPGARLLFVAGQVASDRDGRLVSDDFVAQFDCALANVVAVVTEAGGTAESIGAMRIFVTDTEEYVAARPTIGEAYRRRMGRHYPAMTLVEVKGLLETGAKVEIEAMAVIAPPPLR